MLLALLANLLATFHEGAFGFGGSLVFLALTVPWLGWSTSLGTDCVCASANLLFVSILARTRGERPEGPRPWNLAWSAPLCVLATAAFLPLPESLKVALFSLAALLTCAVFALRPKRWFLAPAAIGVGICNSDAPFGFLAFQESPRGKAAHARYLALLLLAKLAALCLLLPPGEVLAFDTRDFALFIGLGFLGAAAGHRTLGQLADPWRRRVVFAIQGALVATLVTCAVVAT